MESFKIIITVLSGPWIPFRMIIGFDRQSYNQRLIKSPTGADSMGILFMCGSCNNINYLEVVTAFIKVIYAYS